MKISKSNPEIGKKIYFHKYNRLGYIIKQNILGPLLEFSFLIGFILWLLLNTVVYIDYYLSIGISLIFISLSIYFLYLFFIKFYKIKVNRFEIAVKGISKETSLVFLSDIHLGKERIATNQLRIRKIVEIINSLNLDTVIIGGDFVAFDYEDELLNELKNIKAKNKYGVYGNHDSIYLKEKQQSEFPEDGVRRLESTGFKILNNQSELIEIAGQKINLIGVTDLFSLNFNLDESVKEINDNHPRILLSHNPEIIDFIKSEHSIDLVLSGHTHAGQILLPLVGPVLPMPVSRRWLTRGIFNLDEGGKLFISQGVGHSGTRLRIGTDNEITVLTLKPQ